MRARGEKETDGQRVRCTETEKDLEREKERRREKERQKLHFGDMHIYSDELKIQFIGNKLDYSTTWPPKAPNASLVSTVKAINNRNPRKDCNYCKLY